MAQIARAAAQGGVKGAGGLKNINVDSGPSDEELKLAFDRDRVTAKDYRLCGPLAPCLARYRNATLSVGYFLTRPAWEYFILGVIIFAGVLVGVQTYPGMDEDPVVQYCDLVVLAIFTVEIALKVFQEGFKPWRYWVGPEWAWNNFDFIVVILCMPFMGLGGYVAALRLARLARLLKLVNKIPQLKMIVMGMIGGLRAIFYICLLLFMVFYLYAILGIVLFEKNDPWHFGCFADSMTTLYRMATMEDWTDVMYINYYGCDKYHSGIYHLPSEPPKAGLPVNRTTGTGPLADMDTALCANPGAQPFYAALFSITFALISGLVMLSMFVGAVSLSMTSAIDDINEKNRTVEAERRRHANFEEMQSLADDTNDTMPPEAYKRKRRIEKILAEAWDGRPGVHGKMTHDVAFQRLGPVAKAYLVTVAHPVRALVLSELFKSIILVVIIAACILVGAQTDPNVKDTPSLQDPMHIIDRIATGVFALEAVLKIVAEGLRPWLYFASAENLFDFFIVVGSFAFDSGLFILLRLVRLFRVLKLIKSVPELRMHVNALAEGVKSITYIGTIMFMFFYIFGILAWLFFAGNDPWHFKDIGWAMLTLLRCATFEDWTDVMYINKWGCDKYGYLDFPDDCKNPYAWGGYAVIFFMIFETIGSLVLLNLFIGVITASMEESANELQAERDMDERLARLQDTLQISNRQLRMYRDAFDMIDMAESKEISPEEFKTAFEVIGHIEPHPEELTLLFHEARRATSTVHFTGHENKQGSDSTCIDLADFVAFMHQGMQNKGGFSPAHIELRARLKAEGAYDEKPGVNVEDLTDLTPVGNGRGGGASKKYVL
eukprot:g2973.t1